MNPKLKGLLKDARNAYLLACARLVMWRRKPVIIGVTGSVGKTTTKELIAAVLQHPKARRAVGRVWKSPENMNDNELFPLAILGCPQEPRTLAEDLRWVAAAPFVAIAYATFKRYPDTLVLEYAASFGGDVARNALLAPPAIGVVTAIGPAHLERFGTIERIIEEKSALIRNLPPHGLAVLGADNEYTARMDAYTRAPVVKVPGRGRQLSENIARVIARHLRVPDGVADAALADVSAVPGRLNVREMGSVLVIDDTYNANPLSMALGLDTLAEVGRQASRKVAILGEMKELGPEERRYHEEIGELARRRADLVIGVGELARSFAPDHWFADTGTCVDALPALIRPGDCVLAKASHSLHLHLAVWKIEALADLWASQAEPPSAQESFAS